MKRMLKILSLIGLLLTETGCVYERFDKCLTKTDAKNVSLEFLLRDEDGNYVFESNVSTIELGIYNDKGILVMIKHIPQTELAGFQGVRLTLDPGIYYVVGWGNIGENTKYIGVNSPHEYEPRITYTNLNSGRVADADKVYYAPKGGENLIGAVGFSNAYRMTVDPVTGHAGVLEFTAAHRTVKVYVEGYSGGIPQVELLNLPESLAWFGAKWLADSFNPNPVITASGKTTPVRQENVRYDYAVFDTFYFDADNNIILNVVDNSTQEAVCTVTLNEAFEGIGFPVGITVCVMVRFTPAGVEVGIPNWESHEVDPGLGA